MKIFIDGQAGTTGLQLEKRLRKRDDITLLEVAPALRKDPTAKQALMDQVDVIFLCLPDDEAKISAQNAPQNTLVIDASTAHRTAPGWAYGLPELSSSHRDAIRFGKRISVPGCHASGFNAIMYPLVSANVVDKNTYINCTSLTGYSGGGRNLIETYEVGRTPGDVLHAPRPYALGLTHKHLPEMTAVSGLINPPHFYPVVGDMAQGMLVTIHLWDVEPQRLYDILAKHYNDAHFINVTEPDQKGEVTFLDPTAYNGTNMMDIMIFGHNKQAIVAARLDNLGKGASGAAIQCMNIACGLDERTGFFE